MELEDLDAEQEEEYAYEPDVPEKPPHGQAIKFASMDEWNGKLLFHYDRPQAVANTHTEDDASVAIAALMGKIGQSRMEVEILPLIAVPPHLTRNALYDFEQKKHKKVASRTVLEIRAHILHLYNTECEPDRRIEWDAEIKYPQEKEKRERKRKRKDDATESQIEDPAIPTPKKAKGAAAKKKRQEEEQIVIVVKEVAVKVEESGE